MPGHFRLTPLGDHPYTERKKVIEQICAMFEVRLREDQIGKILEVGEIWGSI